MTRRDITAATSLNVKKELLPIMQAYKAGYKKCLEDHGKLKPYISLAQAHLKYGRKIVSDWIDFGLVNVIKDGDGNSKCRIKREEIELVAEASNRHEWYNYKTK